MGRNGFLVTRLVVAFGLLAFGAASAVAHEFWIALKHGTVEPGDTVTADLIVGIMLRGTSYPYFPGYIVRFDITADGKTEPVTGVPGDIPALRYTVKRPGLQVIAQQTVPYRLTYEDWALFRRYVAEEGFPEVEGLHLKRGLPTTGFSERYTRYVKALVQAGPPRPGDCDVRTGLPFELVAEANPYKPGLDVLPVRLYWHDKPAANAQVADFRDTGSVERRTMRTDADGRARIPLQPGFHLLSAVRIDPVDNDTVVWHSHWAALSFVIGK